MLTTTYIILPTIFLEIFLYLYMWTITIISKEYKTKYKPQI